MQAYNTNMNRQSSIFSITPLHLIIGGSKCEIGDWMFNDRKFVNGVCGVGLGSNVGNVVRISIDMKYFDQSCLTMLTMNEPSTFNVFGSTSILIIQCHCFCCEAVNEYWYGQWSS
jgi:hypothetical protein